MCCSVLQQDVVCCSVLKCRIVLQCVAVSAYIPKVDLKIHHTVTIVAACGPHLCVRKYVYIHIRKYVYIHMYVNTYIYVRKYVYIHMCGPHLCVRKYVYIHVNV